MSKAERFAYNKYPKEKKGVLYDLVRNSIIEGYHQAEKDLELTWEDVSDILNFYREVIEMDFCKDTYGEVLKRFKEQRT